MSRWNFRLHIKLGTGTKNFHYLWCCTAAGICPADACRSGFLGLRGSLAGGGRCRGSTSSCRRHWGCRCVRSRCFISWWGQFCRGLLFNLWRGRCITGPYVPAASVFPGCRLLSDSVEHLATAYLSFVFAIVFCASKVSVVFVRFGWREP